MTNIRIQQGTFSLLPDLTDFQIEKQLDYCNKNNFAIGIEYTDDPHPRNSYWEMWSLPLFDMPDVTSIMYEINECRNKFSNMYIKVNAFNNKRGIESTALSFIVQRPMYEPGFYLSRLENKGRSISYTIHSYAVAYNPSGNRYEIF